MVNKMHTHVIVDSYKKQEPIDAKQLRVMLNKYGITTAVSNDNLLIQLSDELVSGDEYIIDGVTYTINGLKEYNKLLYTVDKLTDDFIIIKHNKSGYRLKINLNKDNPVWYDYISDEFERVITMYLKQKPMSFDDLKDFANHSEFRESLYHNNNYIYVLSDFNENITVLDNAKVNMPYKYSGENLSVNETTYTIDGETYKFNDLQEYHTNIYSAFTTIVSRDEHNRITKRYIIKHNESGRYLELKTGHDVDSEQRKKWYEVTPVDVKVNKFVGDINHASDVLLRKLFKQESLSFDESLTLLNKYKVFSYIYKNNSFIHDEIKSDIRYKDIKLDNFDYFEVDGFYIIEGVQYSFESLKEYTLKMFTIHESYTMDDEHKDYDYCIIEHNESGKFLKFESSNDSYSGCSFTDSVWYEVKKQLVDAVEFEVVS